VEIKDKELIHGERGIKKNDGGSEFRYDIFDMLLELL
jgi:hypothetical protein